MNPMKALNRSIDNPWTFTVEGVDEFLAQYTPRNTNSGPSHPGVDNAVMNSNKNNTNIVDGIFQETLPNTESAAATAAVAAAVPLNASAQEMFTFSSPTRSNRNAKPSVDVIDLTFLEDDDDDSSQQQQQRPRSAGGIKTERGGNSAGDEQPEAKRMRQLQQQPAHIKKDEVLPPPPPSTRNALADICKEQFSCPICQDLVVIPYSLVPCSHMFCADCLATWFARKSDCPICRKKCTAPPMHNYQVQEMVAVAATGLGAADKGAWEEKRAYYEARRAHIEKTLKNVAVTPPPSAPAPPPSAAAAAAAADRHSRYLDMMLGFAPGFAALQGHTHALMEGREPPARSMPTARGGGGALPPSRGRETEYRVEYVTEGQQCQCPVCFARIDSVGQIRLGLRPRANNQHEDRLTPWVWHHFECFPQSAWIDARAVSVGNMRSLRGADAGRVRARLSPSYPW